MNLEEIRGLSDAEIVQEIQNQHEEWRNLRFQDALGRLTDVHRIREVRKAIARLKTIQREREIAIDPIGHFASTDRKRARRRVEKQQERLAARRRARRGPSPRRRR